MKLSERVRQVAGYVFDWADEVAQLEAEVERLRGVLEEIADYNISPWLVKDTAKAALKGGE